MKIIKHKITYLILNFFSDSYLASDLMLQVILYFNAYYSGFWMVICIVTFIAKVHKSYYYYHYHH